MILDAGGLTTFQQCPRKYLLNQSPERRRWHPTALLSACLRGLVLDLSTGVDKTHAVSVATTRLKTLCADPGLEILTDPWTLAGDLSAILANFGEDFSRHAFPVVKLVGMLALGGNSWKLSSFVEESGVLHRWVCVEQVDSDEVSRQLHSWGVVGDMAVADVPMTLHLIEIGTTRKGHKHSAWTRAWRHPMIAGRIKFQAKGGKTLQGSWEPLWFQDSDLSSKDWVDLMAGVDLMHHLEVKQLSLIHRDEVRRQIISEMKAIQGLPQTWEEIPMRRAACDIPPCAWQFKCYS